MKIALDFDGTYTEDPDLWNNFIRVAHSKGHQVYIVTFREPDMWHPAMDYLWHDLKVPIVFTSRQAKRQYCTHAGVDIDVWIDDNPDLIVSDGERWSDEQLSEWRNTTNNGQT